MGAVYEKRGDLIKAIDAWLMCRPVPARTRAVRRHAQGLPTDCHHREQSGQDQDDDRQPGSGAGAPCLQAGRAGGRTWENIHLQRGSADEAIRISGPAGGRASHPQVHTMLGIAYMQKSQDREAFGEFQEVVRLTPNEAAFTYEKIGRVPSARGARRKAPSSGSATRQGVSSPRATQRLGRVATRPFSALSRGNKDVLLKLGEIYTQLGMKRPRLQHLQATGAGLPRRRHPGQGDRALQEAGRSRSGRQPGRRGSDRGVSQHPAAGRLQPRRADQAGQTVVTRPDRRGPAGVSAAGAIVSGEDPVRRRAAGRAADSGAGPRNIRAREFSPRSICARAIAIPPRPSTASCSNCSRTRAPSKRQCSSTTR